MTALSVPSLNLMPAPRVARAARRRRVRAWAGVLSASAAIALAAGAYLSLARVQIKSLLPDVQAADARLEHLKAELKATQARAALAEREHVARREVRNHPDLSALLRLVASKAGPQVSLEKFELSPVVKGGGRAPAREVAAPWGYTLRLTGIAGAQAEVPRFAQGLESLGLFEVVTVLGIRAREAPIFEREDGTKVRTPQLFDFDVEAVLSDAGAAGASGGAP